MSKKIYIKDESFDPIYRELSREFYFRTRLLPAVLGTMGIVVLVTQVLLPLIVFKTQDEPNEYFDNKTLLGKLSGFKQFRFSELTDSSQSKNIVSMEAITEEPPLPDNTNPPINPPDDTSNQEAVGEIAGVKDENIPEFFYLTIPKLGIKNAKVETNADTLDPVKALGHYPGTGLPGKPGNSFIFGHSVLPWFFNPKNYKTMFSTIHELEEGDKFQIKYNNNEYTYIVETSVILDPDEVDPLGEFKPKYMKESTVTLMTCSPPGTQMKRLLVQAVAE